MVCGRGRCGLARLCLGTATFCGALLNFEGAGGLGLLAGGLGLAVVGLRGRWLAVALGRLRENCLWPAVGVLGGSASFPRFSNRDRKEDTGFKEDESGPSVGGSIIISSQLFRWAANVPTVSSDLLAHGQPLSAASSLLSVGSVVAG